MCGMAVLEQSLLRRARAAQSVGRAHVRSIRVLRCSVVEVLAHLRQALLPPHPQTRHEPSARDRSIGEMGNNQTPSSSAQHGESRL
jgi:hypothetical protein